MGLFSKFFPVNSVELLSTENTRPGLYEMTLSNGSRVKIEIDEDRAIELVSQLLDQISGYTPQKGFIK